MKILLNNSSVIRNNSIIELSGLFVNKSVDSTGNPVIDSTVWITLTEKIYIGRNNKFRVSLPDGYYLYIDWFDSGSPSSSRTSYSHIKSSMEVISAADDYLNFMVCIGTSLPPTTDISPNINVYLELL